MQKSIRYEGSIYMYNIQNINPLNNTRKSNSMMKLKNFITQIMFASSLFILASCGDDDAHGDAIVGVWDISFLSISGCDDFEDIFSFDLAENGGCITDQGVESCLSGTLIIDADGSLRTILNSTSDGVTQTETSTGTIIVGDNDTITICLNINCEEGHCTLDGDNLILLTTDIDNCLTEIRATKE